MRGWWRPRGRHPEGWAFLLNRLTGLVLVGYLYLHLAVLSLLARGPSSWDSFLRLARSPVALGFDVVLFAAVGWHALNGIRVAVLGTGIGLRRQRTLLLGVAAVFVGVVAAVAWRVFGEG